MMMSVYDGGGHCATFTMPSVTGYNVPRLSWTTLRTLACAAMNWRIDVGKRWVFVVNQEVGSEI